MTQHLFNNEPTPTHKLTQTLANSNQNILKHAKQYDSKIKQRLSKT